MKREVIRYPTLEQPGLSVFRDVFLDKDGNVLKVVILGGVLKYFDQPGYFIADETGLYPDSDPYETYSQAAHALRQRVEGRVKQ